MWNKGSNYQSWSEQLQLHVLTDWLCVYVLIVTCDVQTSGQLLNCIHVSLLLVVNPKEAAVSVRPWNTLFNSVLLSLILLIIFYYFKGCKESSVHSVYLYILSQYWKLFHNNLWQEQDGIFFGMSWSDGDWIRRSVRSHSS